MAREQQMAEEFELLMLQKPVEISVFAVSTDPNESVGEYHGSYSGILDVYTTNEAEWSWRMRGDTTRVLVRKDQFTILITYYTF